MRKRERNTHLEVWGERYREYRERTCVYAKERERENVCVSVREREKERMCVSVRERERKREYVCL